MDNDFPTRMAGQALMPYVNPGQGCAKKPERYPAQPKGGMSHGPQLIESYVSRK
tara:strand:+ start:165 stop:326 length:162 start_codon:yes stop_codon:yes gene_type:complete